MSSCKKFVGVVASTFIAISVTACTQIADTTATLVSQDETCSAALGGYYLPKKLVSLTITREANKPYKLTLDDKLKWAADRKGGLHCLDFLGSIASEDRLGVSRSTSGLLQKVFTKADDKTATVVTTLAKTISTGIALGKSNALRGAAEAGIGTSATARAVARYTFDPFNREWMREINNALAGFGYCIFLDTRSDPFAPEWSPGQCGVKRYHQKRRASSWSNSLKDLGPDYAEPRTSRQASRKLRPGIYYRPNLTHTLMVLRREDPGSGEMPDIFRKTRILMPNAAPTFSIGVERSMFVARETSLSFDNGVLADVSIKKPSEISAFMEIPLAIARAVVAIPAQVVQIRINTANNRLALINAQAKLIETVRSSKPTEPTTALIVPTTGMTPANQKNTIFRSKNTPSANRSATVQGTGGALSQTALRNLEAGACDGLNFNDNEAGRKKCLRKLNECLETSGTKNNAVQCATLAANAVVNEG